MPVPTVRFAFSALLARLGLPSPSVLTFPFDERDLAADVKNANKLENYLNDQLKVYVDP